MRGLGDKGWTSWMNKTFFLHYPLGRGINGEGFNSKLAMVKMCSTWSLLNKYVLSKKLSGSSDQLPYTPIGPMGKDNIWKSEFCFCHGQNVFTVTPLEQICPFKNFWSESSDSTITSDPWKAYGKGQHLKIWNLFSHGQIYIHSNLKRIILPFEQNSDVIYSLWYSL